MLFSKHLSWLMAVWILATASYAEEPSFPHPIEEDEATLKLQYAIQFYEAPPSIESFLSEADGIEEIVREIPTRKIVVVRFSSEKAAAKWKSKTRGIKYFVQDSMVYLDRNSSGPYDKARKLVESTPYGITQVKAEEVSDDNAGSIKVCIIDSGYDLNHPDLPSDTTTPLVTGESFVSGTAWSTDESSHGTHVAGTIAALGGNGIGVKGVIREGNVKLHISKVFPGSGSASWSTIVDGFESCVAAGANVVNMSLGGGEFPPFQDAINDAYNINKMLIFASSGNSGSSGYNYPASFDNVISVASIDSSYSRSSFSTFNDKVDICAPGSSVESTLPGGGYGYKSGTSMACPHAAGVAALVWSTYPSLSHERLINILESTAQDLPLNSNDGKDIYYGHGLINAKAAYDAVQVSVVPTVSPAPSLPPVPTLRPSEVCSIGFGVVVELLTDNFPTETSWDIKDASGTVVESGLGYTEANTVYQEELCLPELDCYSFTIYDYFGDGICCTLGSGYYNVYIDNELKASGGDFTYSETTSFCDSPPVTPTVPPTATPTVPPTATPTVPPTPCSNISTRRACNNAPPGGCYWSRGDCLECSSITRRRQCEKKASCTWSSNSCN